MDIDRLHKTVERLREGRQVPRRQGQTEALLQLMLGEVWLGGYENRYMFIGYNMRQAIHAQRRFLNILESEGYGCIIGVDSIFIKETQQHFRFIGAHDANRLHGYQAAEYFVDKTEPEDSDMWEHLDEVVRRRRGR